MFSLFKKKREFLPWDIVTPINVFEADYHKMGIVRKFIKRKFWTDQVVVEYFHKELSSSGEKYFIEKTTITYEDSASIRLCEPTQRLFHPLKNGDQFFISKDVDIFLKEERDINTLASLLDGFSTNGKVVPSNFFDEPQTIFFIGQNYANPAQPYFVVLNESGENEDFVNRWLSVNIDIPRTNRLQMKKYQPKSRAHLPDI